MPISKRPSSRRFPTHLAFVVTFISLSFDEILTHQCRSLLFLPSRTEQGPVVRIGTGVGLLQCTLEDGAHGQLIGVGGFGYSHAHTLAHTHTLYCTVDFYGTPGTDSKNRCCWIAACDLVHKMAIHAVSMRLYG